MNLEQEFRTDYCTIFRIGIVFNTGVKGLNGQCATIGQDRHPFSCWTDLIKGS